MNRPTLAVLLCLLSPLPAVAIQQRNVELLLPRGGTRGSTVEVVLQGMDISDPKEVVFYRGGITAGHFEVLPPLTEPITLHHGAKMVERVRARFTIAPDCPLGEHPLRLRTGTTLSTLCTFWVGPFPTVEETEKSLGDNDTPAKAQRVPLNTTVAGKIHPGNRFDRDLYRVELKAGQRLAVEVEGLRASMMAYGDVEFDFQTAVLDAAGREVAHNDDSGLFVQDPLLTYLAPADGGYFVEVRQRMFRPFSWGFYRVHIGTFARPVAAYPAGGPGGEKWAVRLLGDAAGETTQTVTAPAAAGTFDFYPGRPGEQPPSPLPLRASPYPNVLEAEPNGPGDPPTPAPSLPIALNGVIEKPGDADCFRLPLVKGTSYRVRVYARSLGTAIDPKISLRPVSAPADQVELEADDSSLRDRDLFAVPGTAHPKDLLDPSVVFTPRQDGDYVLTVADTRGLGGPTAVYRVEVEPAGDAVYTYVAATANDAFETNRVTGFIVPQGNSWTLNVLLGEGQGNRYKGDLELEARGLPPGVRMIAPRVTGGLRVVPVQFVAEAGTPPQTALIEIVARATDPKVKLTSGSQQAVPFVNHSGGHAWHSLLLDRYALAVTNPAPFHLEVDPPLIPLARAGELTLTVKLVRHGAFAEAVDILPEWLPPGVAGESSVTIPPGQDAAKFSLHADPNARTGRFKVAVNGTTTGGLYYSGVGRTRVSSPFVELAVDEPYLAVSVHRAAVERGRSAKIVCDVHHLKPFPGRAVATLRQLPNGVKLIGPAPRIAAGDKRITFEVEAAPEALVGQYSGVVCEVTVEENGQSIRQQCGTGVIRVDPARGAPSVSPESKRP